MNCKLCNTQLEKLDYYCGDTFNMSTLNCVLENDKISKTLYCCPCCGLVYAKREDEDS